MNLHAKELSKILKALANQRRLMILGYLKRQEKAKVGDIAKEIDLSLKATSKHIFILEGRGILSKEQKGLEVFCRLS